MLFPIIIVFLMGTASGVAITTNEPAVQDFGHKYLAADTVNK